MTKILSQDDQKDGDAVNQERERKRQSSLGKKEEVCGAGETCRYPGPDSTGGAELEPKRKTKARSSDLEICPGANS